MENHNAEQIKKALECCHKDSNCDGCMYGKYRRKKNGTCIELMQRDALALITSQEQRIGELTEESERLRNRITCQVVLPDEKLEEIKNECLERVELDIKKIEADTVRKMQERLRIYFGTYVLSYKIPLSEALKAIDQIAKEMLEGEK